MTFDTGIDIRSVGGLIVAPGSVIDGKTYTLHEDLPIADAPQWLIDKVGAPRKKDERRDIPAISAEDIDSDELVNAAINYLENRAPEAVQGQGGDSTTYSVACNVRDLGISEALCLELMAEHYNNSKCFPPWPLDREPNSREPSLACKVRSAYKSAQNRLGAKASQHSARIEFNAPRENVEPDPIGKSEEPFYYDVGKKEYLVRSDKRWLPQNEAQFKRRLRKLGMSTRAAKGEMLSKADVEILRVQDNCAVDYAGSLAGHRKGYSEQFGTRVLITQEGKLVEPKEGRWDTLEKVFEGVLGSDGHKQLIHFYGWLKVALESLYSGEFMYGQCLVIAGPRMSGKSLIKLIITELLGGRAGKPYQFLTGRSEFNADLFTAEHLTVDDEAPNSDHRSRRSLGNCIKQFTVNHEQRLHAKGRDALLLKPFWRLSILLNDETEDLHVLPQISTGLEDKLILFQAAKKEMPMPTNTSVQKKIFWEQLVAELPAFAWWLLNDFEIPMDLICERFGITHFHHPELLAALRNTSPEAGLLELIDQHVPLPFKGTAEEIQKIVQAQAPRRATGLLYFPGACGTFLSRLAEQTDRVIKQRTSKQRLWEILPTGGVATTEPPVDWLM